MLWSGIDVAQGVADLSTLTEELQSMSFEEEAMTLKSYGNISDWRIERARARFLCESEDCCQHGEQFEMALIVRRRIRNEVDTRLQKQKKVA